MGVQGFPPDHNAIYHQQLVYMDDASTPERVPVAICAGIEITIGVTLKEEVDMSTDTSQATTGSTLNAVETVLHALASCLSVGFSYNAAGKGIEVRSLDFALSGDLDLRGFLGLDDDVRPGFSQIEVTYRVDAEAPRDKLEELCEYTKRTSPVVDLLRNPVNVSISMGS
jgi:uncharacterized OsmC-like protein